MNTIRDKIPVEALLRQYIDESTDYIVKEPEVKPEVKPETKPEVKADVKPEVKTEPKPEVKVDPTPEMETFPMEIPPKVETKSEPMEEPKQKLSFNPEVQTFDLPPLEVLEDDFKIGEDVPLNTMCFDEMDKDTIDLGIVEL
jgi:hypothetical protein